MRDQNPISTRFGGVGDLALEELERRVRGDRDTLPLREWIALAEAWRIAQALREARGNRSAAARSLGIGRRTLYTKMEKLGLEAVWTVAPRRDGFVAASLPSHDSHP